MNAHEFYRDVAERAMLSKGEAADLTRAVLEVLAMSQRRRGTAPDPTAPRGSWRLSAMEQQRYGAIRPG